MSLPLRAGLILGFLVTCWTYAFGVTGWYKSPERVGLFVPVAILLQVGVLAWSLARTRKEQPFLRQFLNGITTSLVASALIFLGSYLFTTVVYPTYFQELQDMGRRVMAQQGRSPQEIEAAAAQYASVATPFRNAFAGVIGTWATGVLVSLLLALGLKRKA